MAAQAPAHPAMAVVDKMYACFAKGDMATLKSEVFASDITWNLPGHHPLSGIKNGPDEVIALLADDPPPAPPAFHEVRDGLIVRWIDIPG